MLQKELDFSAYIAERTRDFAGREWVFATIDRWLTDPDSPQIFLLVGEPGIGKTAIAARLTQFSAGDAMPPADYACVGDGFLSAVHFCSARNGGWISPDGFARSLSVQLAARYPAFADVLSSDLRIHIEQRAGTVSGTMIGAQITNYYAETSEALFNDLVRTPLQALCSKNGLPALLTILVDGLDESLNYSGRTNIVRLLVAYWDLPVRVRLLLTSRPVDGVLEPFRPLQPFILYAHSEENQGDVGAYVEHRFATSAALHDQAGDEAQVERVRDSLVTRSGGNFLVISKVLDGAERGELSLDDPEALPAELQDLYVWFLDRLIQGDIGTWRRLYRPVLGVLAVAQEPVDASTLCRWTSLTYQQVTDVLHDLREFLDPALEGCYRLYHESVVDFLTGDRAGPYTLGATEHHRRIAVSYVERFIKGKKAWTDCDEYGLRHLPIHLSGSGQTECLCDLLLDFDWLQTKLDATDVIALHADYHLLPGDKDLQLVQEAVKLSAHVLAEDKAQLAGQLLGRLRAFEVPEVYTLLEQCRQWQNAPWLRPLTPSLEGPGGPLLRTLKGHTGVVDAVAVTEDRQVISGSRDGTLKAWNLEDGKELFTLRAHPHGSDMVTDLAITPDGKRAISAHAYDRSLRVWDLKNKRELFVLETLSDDWGAVLVVTPDGQMVICGSGDGTLKAWSMETGNRLFTLTGHSARVTAVVVASDGKRAVSGSRDGAVRVWDLENREELCALHSHEGPISSVALTPDGKWIICGLECSMIEVWSLDYQSEHFTLRGHGSTSDLTPRGVWALAVTPDGRRVISAANWDNELLVWDLKNGRLLGCLKGHGICVTAVVVTSDGQRAVSAGYDNTVRVWDLNRPLAMRSKDMSKDMSKDVRQFLVSVGLENMESTWMGHTDGVTGIVVTPNGKHAISGSRDGTLKVWSLIDGAELHTLRGHASLISALAVTPDGLHVVSASFDHTLRVWDLNSGQECFTLEGHQLVVQAVTAIPGTRRVISAADDRTLRIWDLTNGKEVLTLRGHENSVRAVAVTPDGLRAISASVDNTVKIWDLDRGIQLHTLPYLWHVFEVKVTPDGLRAVAFSPVIRTVETSGGKINISGIKVWDVGSGTELLTLDHFREPIALLPDGQHAISARALDLKVWRLEDGIERLTLQGHTDRVNQVTVTPNGKRAVSSSYDHTLKVWDLVTGNLIASFTGEGCLTACAVAPDGRTAVVGEMSGRVHILRLEGVEWET